LTNDNTPLVPVASFATPLEAHLIKGLLEAEGLQVAIADEHLVSANSALAYAVGGVKLESGQPFAALACARWASAAASVAATSG
jgi:hypothetical protein